MAAAPARQVPFVSTPIDFLAIGGLSILHFFLFLWFRPAISQLAPPLEQLLGISLSAGAVAAYVTWVVNHPHFSATSARLYRSRSTIMQFPVTALVVPVVIVGVALLALVNPGPVAPWFLKLFLFWSSYHFSAQTLGISLLYARRAGLVVDGLTRRCLSVFIFSSFLAPMLRAESRIIGMTYYDVTLPTFGLMPEIWDFFRLVMLISGCLAFVLLLRAAWQQEKQVPLLMLLPAATQFVWFIPGATVPGFVEFVPAYHSLQYLFIAWLMQLKEKQAEQKIIPSRQYVTRESLRWLTINIAGGIFLFWLLPKGGQSLGLAATATQTWGIVIAAVQIHHFFVDGVIWKLKNPQVGQPLMTSFGQLSGKAAA
jgi:hypothetical protein